MKEIFNIRLAGRVKLILICSGEIYRLLKYYFFGSFIVYTFPTIIIITLTNNNNSNIYLFYQTSQ